MELDKRIKEGKKPLDCFDAEIAKQFIGKKGFFGKHKSQFMNLDTCPKSVIDELNKIDNYDEYSFVTSGNHAYMYFLPVEWVKEPEKKYRPYKNIQELFEDIGVYIGDTIHFRSKAKETESHALITSYTTLKNGAEEICLGGAYYYTMQALFDLFELRSRGEWQPFGVEIQGEE